MPTLAKLSMLQTSGGKKIKIIEKVAPMWQTLGDQLDFDESHFGEWYSFVWCLYIIMHSQFLFTASDYSCVPASSKSSVMLQPKLSEGISVTVCA